MFVEAGGKLVQKASGMQVECLWKAGEKLVGCFWEACGMPVESLRIASGQFVEM